MPEICFPISTYTFEEKDLKEKLFRRESGNKGTFGKVLLIAGNEMTSGAALYKCLFGSAYGSWNGKSAYSKKKTGQFFRYSFRSYVLLLWQKRDKIRSVGRKSGMGRCS